MKTLKTSILFLYYQDSHWVENYCVFNLRPKQIVDTHSNDSLINLTGKVFTQYHVIDCIFLYRVSTYDKNKMMDK